jgi:thioredoxin 1
MVHHCVQELGTKEFEKIISDKGIIVVDFFAEWCMPCLMMAPVFEELCDNDKFKGKVKFAKINIDDNSDLASKFKVMSIPTIIAFKDGKELKRFIGAMQPDDLENRIEALI